MHSIQIFFKMATQNIQNMKKRLQPPPPSSFDFDGLPYNRVRWYPHFFHQNDRKGCKKDYLYALDQYFQRFGATGKKQKGGCNHPLGQTRVNVLIIIIRVVNVFVHFVVYHTKSAAQFICMEQENSLEFELRIASMQLV